MGISKIATNRTNFAYASDLKRKGYLTAVHALPSECKDYVESRLAGSISPKTIANELMSRYGKEIEASGLKPLSHMSIRNYRDKYWRNTTQFNRIILEGTEVSQKAIDKVMNQFNAYEEMVNMAKKQFGKASLADNLEDKTKLPSKRGDESRLQAFNMALAILEKEIELGLRQRAPVTINSSIVTDTKIEWNTDELISKAKDAIDAIEKKGKYAKRLSTGEKL
jgi:hypothetical protein